MKRFFVLTGFVLACSTAAIAQDDRPKTEDLFQQLDKNGDGKLEKSEIPEQQVRFFERLVRLGDADENGELTPAEFKKATSETIDAPSPSATDAGAGRRPGNPAARQFDAAEFFKRLDRNSDGKLSREELPEAFAERLGPVFEKLGKDAISQEEFQQLRQQMERGGAGQPNGGRPGQFGNPAESFKRLDANGDGKLTVDEAPEPGRRFVAMILERSGKGRDGSLTLQEFVSTVAQFNRGSQDGRPENANRPAPEGDAKRPESDRPARDGDMRRPEDGDRPASGGPAFLRILDANQDGQLSRDELAKAVSLIERLDQNGDGALDPRELFGAPGQDSMNRPRPNGNQNPSDRPRRPESQESDRDKPRDGQRPDAEQLRRDGRQSPAELEENFKRMDSNQDGVLSRDEVPVRLKENFEQTDSDKNGSISLDELRRAFERSRSR